MHDFDAPLDRKNTDCVKWDSLEKTYGSADLIPLWLADPDYSPLIDVRATAFRMLELVETLLPREFHRSRGRRFLHYYCDNFTFGHHVRSKTDHADSIADMRAILEGYFTEVPGDRVTTERRPAVSPDLP